MPTNLFPTNCTIHSFNSNTTSGHESHTSS
jgi:hypothetical protein